MVKGKKDDKRLITPIEAYLNLPAFLGIVSSSIEVFRKETIGYLLGFKGENKFIVEYAIPYQAVETGLTHATVDMDRVARINEILGKVSEGIEFIGDFHSHTQYGDAPATVTPSSSDLMSSVPGDLNIICAVNLKKRSVKWHEDNRGVLIGTIGSYRIIIGGFYVAKAGIGARYQRVSIKCPSVTGLREKKK
ncbi:hypothetical protein AMJ52_00185 [candidate division TA06 bacterium DG_78]|uniref:JAB domain-containing protein n=1 Tax=candidate division TA06 bacterium DG_78 TaxID=1703772 RepID=A0A0S7YIT4_UNCT6|nr:MAG: hypothetical protein AMJ52_00185 [candidate division TA06 bacterium DG_78]